jgi:3'-5' exoribonuclease
VIKKFVADIRERDQVQAVFLVKDKIMAMAKNGKPYMNLRLMDKTGEIDCKIWDDVDRMNEQFDKDDFVQVIAKASSYLGKMQLVVAELCRVPESQVNLADFLPETARNIDEMEGELRSIVAGIANPHLRQLMERFLTDTAFLSAYRVAPAAKGMHHVYLGGLLEHSLAVVALVDQVAPLYPVLNRDLLVVGALLHDIGKIREMSYARSFDYTDEGKLIGHITIGVEMITEKVAHVADFPAELAMLVKHLILSHHGQYEYGSPKRPKTLEATVLNYLDDMDAKINGITSHINKEAATAGRWTSYHRLYDRYFYTGGSREEAALVDNAPEPAPPANAAPERTAEREKKESFSNSPFAKLAGENLDLF